MTRTTWHRGLASAMVALAMITGCGTGGTADGPPSTVAVAGDGVGGSGDNIDASSYTQGIYVSLAPDAPDGDVIQVDRFRLDEMATYPEIRQEVLATLAAEPVPVLAGVSGGPAGERVFVKGRLPDSLSRFRGGDGCVEDHIQFLATEGDVLVHVGPGVCGMVDTILAFEFGADGVEIADRRFIDGAPDPSAPGTVGIDRPAVRGFAPGEAVEVVLDPVLQDQIAPPLPHLEEWPPLRPFVCFDVTVHSGAAGADDQVVPDIAIAQAGEPVPVPEPTDQRQPRGIAQDPDSTVVWSFGPIDMDEHQPDSITVTESEGEIASWDASARHC